MLTILSALVSVLSSPQLGGRGKPQQADAKIRQRLQDEAVDVVFDVLDLRAVYLGLTGDHRQTVSEGVIDGEPDITRYNYRIARLCVPANGARRWHR